MTDVGAFSIIVIRLLWRRPPSVRMSSVVQTIVKDATIYVLLLCTSRIIFVFLLVFSEVLTTLILHNVDNTEPETPPRTSVKAPDSRTSDLSTRAPPPFIRFANPRVSQWEQRIHVNHDNQNVAVPQKDSRQGIRSRLGS